MKETLKQLTGLCGPSGYESIITESISKLFSQYCDEVVIDKLSNVIAIKRGTGTNNTKKSVMIAAHMDEIGMMVSNIDDRGFIRFLPVGGIDPKILPAQEVIIHGKRKVNAVIGAKPPHLLNEEDKKEVQKIDKYYIDTGMCKKELEEIVQIGDIITFKPNWIELQNELVSSKSLDNRGGVAVLVEILKELKNINHDLDVICVATVQEEVGMRGAIVSAYGVSPDAAIVVDGCHGDMPGTEKGEAYELGKGPAIAIGPNLHSGLTEYIKTVAGEENIPYQIDVEPGDTGTDAWVTQVSKSGIPTLLVSFPLRYMHTTVETVNINDLKNTAKLISHYVSRLGERLEGLQCC